jgi:dTDP-4-dehydrorhamnose 3,5-epimerase
VKVEPLAIPDVKLVTPQKFGDARGFFSETWQQDRFAEAGIPGPFIQDNHALSTQCGVLRGLHLQVPPSAQGKLVRVVRGAIWDVAVDVRHGSASFGKWVAAELSEENWQQLWVPVGFLHGYCTLTEVTEVIYKVSGPYDRTAERGVIWNDPNLALPWPVPPGGPLLSDKDKLLPRLSECPVWFTV